MDKIQISKYAKLTMSQATTLIVPKTVNVIADFSKMERNVLAIYDWMDDLFLSSVMRHAWF